MILPAHVPPRTQSFSGCVPVRLDGAPNGPLAGLGLWRGVKDFEHATLCRAFGLDQCAYFFDLPSSVRGVGSNLAGFGGNRGRRVVNGYVMHAAFDRKPVGKLTMVYESERFRDVDPRDERDFFNLNHS
jgi:hypothetical protein